MDNQFTRTKILIGNDNIEKLKNKKVAIFGLGGVGSFVLEGLARAGIGNFLLVDHDMIDITNLNRQLLATYSTIGKSKVEIAKDRILDMIYTETVNKCSEWNEKNEYGNQITIEYLKNVLRFDISILSEINNYSKEEIKFIISSYSDDLLGGHSIDACVENDKINCIFQ